MNCIFEAERDYEEVLKIDAECIRAINNISCVRLHSGRSTKSLELLINVKKYIRNRMQSYLINVVFWCSMQQCHITS